MDRDLLERYLSDGLSLSQIGDLVGRDPSTVGYWLKKHGLVANGRSKHASKGGLSREQLEPLVEEGLTAGEIAARLGCSARTVYAWLRRHDLKLARHWRIDEAVAARAAGQTRFAGKCRTHGRTDFLVFPNGRSRCAKCNNEAVVQWRRRTKLKLIAEAGGKCVICGYDRWPGALQFHHLDPARKEFALAMFGITRAIDKLRKEASKCVLLCANCHAEVEGGAATVP